jgi:hypothetical protein
MVTTRASRGCRALLVAAVVLVSLSGWVASAAAKAPPRHPRRPSIALVVTSPRRGEVVLTWHTAVAAASFSVVRDGHVLRTLPRRADSYVSRRLHDDVTYSFRVLGRSERGGVISDSVTDSIDPDGRTGSGGTGGTVGTLTNWPCTGCIVSVPSTYNPHIPTALLVALHGDEGAPAYIASTWMPVTQKANVILFAPQCPISEGCDVCVDGDCAVSWWGWFQYSSTYDDAWIGRQVETIEKSYDIDRAREYVTGWSGGADYLGWYALAHADRFAAANFVVGGVPYFPSCPSRPLAAYFLMGSEDFRYLSGQPTQVQQVLQGCGDSTVMVVLPGEDHQGTIDALSTQGYATTILAWLMKHILTGKLPA